METDWHPAESLHQSLDLTDQTNIDLVDLVLQENIDSFNQWKAYRVELEPILSKEVPGQKR